MFSFPQKDFGLASRVGGEEYEEGDGRYLAPELLVDTHLASLKSDVYSLGAVLYECVTGALYRPQDRGQDQDGGGSHGAASASNKGRLAGFPSPQLAELVAAMLARDPRARPSANNVTRECAALAA